MPIVPVPKLFSSFTTQNLSILQLVASPVALSCQLGSDVSMFRSLVRYCQCDQRLLWPRERDGRP